MTGEPKPTRSAKKRRRKPREQIVDDVVAIEGWDWGYSFSLNSERQPIDPYDEFRHLQVKGAAVAAGGAEDREGGDFAAPFVRPGEERRRDLHPIALGSLHVTQDAILGNIGIPRAALTPILQMLIAGRFNFVLMQGSRFRHRSAKLSSLRLETALTEDDVALGEESAA